MIKRSFLIVLFSYFLLTTIAYAEENVDEEEQKINLFKQMEAITYVPWYYYAAINQYESNIRKASEEKKLIDIEIPDEKWYGLAPQTSNNPSAIELFLGMGRDGDGDGKTDKHNEMDILYTFGNYLQGYGHTEQDIKAALWNYYRRDLTVLSIMNYARLMNKYQKITFDTTSFPIPQGYNYSYRNTWGDARGFGGRRIHEGTDIFANYGTPVRATTFGIVELKGWNKFGGWRIGIRDIYNRYHYYAHLNGFAEGIEVGDVVEAGQTIGSVGSSGYGPPGTSGKFPPHLHYGMYKDDGKSEWSFDPFPYLKKWERNTP
ncbi:M23 family metallopeptidase [Gracilibacillus xinjiangensis]|uniref:M23 family metallopeptidase n=1 Tax=Gracilibacillus xinjiangensis TaxID=1193282 RepID=A0ABV8WY84_9BACI